jgi:hypothetical protein
MSELQMKYFVLRPKGTDLHAKASRAAMRQYAKVMAEENAQLAVEVLAWATNEQTEAFPRSVELAVPPQRMKVCPICDQPVLPIGFVKQENEYDHASGCPDAGKTEQQYMSEGVHLNSKVLKPWPSGN